MASLNANLDSVVRPCADDWVVSLTTTEGVTTNRRINAGYLSEEVALRLALHIGALRTKDVDYWSIRRASDSSLVLPDSDDPLVHLLNKRRA